MSNAIRAGQRFLWSDGSDWLNAVSVEIRRVAKDGTWADLHCSAGNAKWSKRQPLPLGDGFREVAL